MSKTFRCIGGNTLTAIDWLEAGLLAVVKPDTKLDLRNSALSEVTDGTGSSSSGGCSSRGSFRGGGGANRYGNGVGRGRSGIASNSDGDGALKTYKFRFNLRKDR